jgi:hypothetical protein
MSDGRNGPTELFYETVRCLEINQWPPPLDRTSRARKAEVRERAGSTKSKSERVRDRPSGRARERHRASRKAHEDVARSVRNTRREIVHARYSAYAYGLIKKRNRRPDPREPAADANGEIINSRNTSSRNCE